MTVQEEDAVKQQFIADMGNKYDYADYKKFCVDNGYWLMSFIQYASLVEPYEPPEVVEVNRAAIARSNCCGGGEVK